MRNLLFFLLFLAQNWNTIKCPRMSFKRAFMHLLILIIPVCLPSTALRKRHQNSLSVSLHCQISVAKHRAMDGRIMYVSCWCCNMVSVCRATLLQCTYLLQRCTYNAVATRCAVVSSLFIDDGCMFDAAAAD